MASTLKLFGRVSLDAVDFVRGAKTAQKAMASLSATAEQVGSRMATGLKVGVLALGALGVASLAASKDFNKSMANVASLMPGNTAKIVEMKNAVLDMSKSSGIGAMELSKGLYDLVSAFGQTSESMAQLEINSKLAQAGQGTIQEALAVTSAVTKAYGDTSAEAMQHVADLTAMTVNLGQTTLPELAGALGGVTPLASTLGVSLEELNAFMATFTGVTGNASEVATQMKGAMQAFLAPTDAAQQVIESMGYSSGKAMVESLGLAGAMQAMTDHSERAKVPLADLMGSVEAQTLAYQLAGKSAGDFSDKMSAMGDVTGTVDAQVKEQTTGLGALYTSWERVKAGLTAVSITLGDVFGPAATELLDAFTAKVGDLETWIRTEGPAIGKAFKTFVLDVMNGDTDKALKQLAEQWDKLGPALEPAWKKVEEWAAKSFSKITDLAVAALAAAGPKLTAALGNKVSELADQLKYLMSADVNMGTSQGDISDSMRDNRPGGYAMGGPIGGIGTGTSDSNLAWLSKGEYVINAASTRKHKGLLDAVNADRYAEGGAVGSVRDFASVRELGGHGPQDPTRNEFIAETFEEQLTRVLGSWTADVSGIFGGGTAGAAASKEFEKRNRDIWKGQGTFVDYEQIKLRQEGELRSMKATMDAVEAARLGISVIDMQSARDREAWNAKLGGAMGQMADSFFMDSFSVLAHRQSVDRGSEAVEQATTGYSAMYAHSFAASAGMEKLATDVSAASGAVAGLGMGSTGAITAMGAFTGAANFGAMSILAQQQALASSPFAGAGMMMGQGGALTGSILDAQGTASSPWGGTSVSGGSVMADLLKSDPWKAMTLNGNPLGETYWSGVGAMVNGQPSGGGMGVGGGYGPTSGDIYLDGQAMGSWMSRQSARDSSRNSLGRS